MLKSTEIEPRRFDDYRTVSQTITWNAADSFQAVLTDSRWKMKDIVP